jgi:hypothetical protein
MRRDCCICWGTQECRRPRRSNRDRRRRSGLPGRRRAQRSQMGSRGDRRLRLSTPSRICRCHSDRRSRGSNILRTKTNDGSGFGRRRRRRAASTKWRGGTGSAARDAPAWHTGTLQSWPDQPPSQAHVPLAQEPLIEQLPGHANTSMVAQSAPRKPGSHTHAPSTHTPRPLHPSGQKTSSARPSRGWPQSWPA